MTTCVFCNAAPALKRSHVASHFFGRYIQKNSPTRYMLHSWKRSRVQDHDTGSYLCAQCDNVTFSQWEDHFASRVWHDPCGALAEWDSPDTRAFVNSLVWRQAVHLRAIGLSAQAIACGDHFCRLTEPELKGSRSSIRTYIYPWVYRPLTRTCALIPGVNHYLNLAIHAIALPDEAGLPDAMLVIVPKVVFLVCDGDLSLATGNTMADPVELCGARPFDPVACNQDLLDFVAPVVNGAVGRSRAHQQSMGLWDKLACKADKRLHPAKVCYQASEYDRQLADWRRSHCR